MKKKRSDFLPPEPIELAKLAAILRPDFKPKAALKPAMEFYVEAVLFSRELPSTLEEIVTQFGSEERWKALLAAPVKEALKKDWSDTLELDPNPKKNEDEARQFLEQRGFPMKKARSVLENIRRYCQSAANDPHLVTPMTFENVMAKI